MSISSFGGAAGVLQIGLVARPVKSCEEYHTEQKSSGNLVRTSAACLPVALEVGGGNSNMTESIHWYATSHYRGLSN